MNLNLKGKTALVCGGSQGLGLATAKELALLGATVILASRTVSKLQEAVKILDISAGQQHQYLVMDLAIPTQTKNTLLNYLTEDLPIHILINNSGGPSAGPLLNTHTEELENAFSSHVISSHVLAQILLPGMLKAGYGRIVNILSTSVKQPINGLGISNTIRAAMANWAKTLANEIGHSGITVNNILPGFTNTERLNYLFTKQAVDQGVTKEEIEKSVINSIPAKRIGSPEEFAAVAAFLCTPAASYINGVNIPVDGGRTGSL